MTEQHHQLSPLFSWRSAICDSDLRPTVRHVALVLSLHMNERGGSCFPAVGTLAKETGLADRNVQRALVELRQKRWLQVEDRHRKNGSQTSNLYIADVPLRPPWMDPPGDATVTPPPDATVTP